VPKPMVLAPGHVKVIKQGSVDKHSGGICSGRIKILQRAESRNAEGRNSEVNENHPSQRANKT
jgi:hypothetical protein